MKKNILYLCHRIPYPPNKGDKIRSFNEIKYFSKNHTIDLLTLADDPEDLRYAENLKEYCRQVMVFPLNKISGKIKGFFSLLFGQSISQGYFYKREFQSTFDKWTRSKPYDDLICFSSPMAEYVFRAQKKIKDIAKNLIMDFCDLDSEKWNLYAQKTAFPLNKIYKKEASRLLQFEIKINKAFDKSVFVSHKEAVLFIKHYPGAKNIQVVSNGVDYQYFDSEKTEISQFFSSPMLVFSGAMDYYANIDGVTWFAKEILPEIKKKIPDVNFYIVGSNPDPRVKALEKDTSIIVTGFVKDIREYYKAADLCIIPLRIARGVQNKVLEAMAMGKAVISTTPAVQGINPKVKQVVEIEDDPLKFARKIISVMNNTDRIKELGNSASIFVVQNYNWGKNLNGFFDN
ncbi:TIGR03087 family PEP-CTERM/XrtA system glycosyltransferase [Desulfobacula phenolica]|uniref:Sugar transferase, PEP-CTERM/EpsH1 system associated n=1 Tax=Desulfobacula phenolica TaxID=90732 RepID=A0A1H2ENQ1_9BACT|nr:TIGR03087 family PEP-CTERM/XrtA system glycosyltransferase [Desulfobacula phenolica]SDT96756.1 sugar transferase, PEP-CTERM/EpsH1 system associated [Desulfobacula phenolica]